MTSLERRQKIFLSVPVLFLLFAVPFGFMMQVIEEPSNQRSLVGAAFVGIPFGIIMTIATKFRINKFNKSTGLADPKQQLALHDAVKKGILPTNPDVLRAMPAYLEKRIKNNQNSKKYPLVLLVIIGIANGWFAIDYHDFAQGLLAVFVIGLAVVSYFITLKQAEKLDRLQRKLKST